ncbi:MAG: phosphatase PAP2 family protein [Acidobacteria bacterium]|nr:phosphatase PAP2 family protein [Acidobacteriota bacterium]
MTQNEGIDETADGVRGARAGGGGEGAGATPATVAAQAGERADAAAAARPAIKRRWDLLRRLAAARRLWRAEFSFLVGLSLFGVLALYAKAYSYFAWDERVADAVQSVALPGTEFLMRAGSFFGDGPNSWIVSAAGLLIFLTYGRRTEAAGLLVSTAGGPLINRLVKHLIDRPRPTMEHVRVSGEWAHESFPSGHVTFYVCFFGFLFFVAFALLPKGSLKRRAVCALAALPVLTVGLSRVYLGAHWPSDTLGAYLLSGLWLAVSLHLYRRWKERSTLHPEDAVSD